MTPRPRFAPQHRTDAVRVALLSRVLVGGGSVLLALLSRTGSRRIVHAAERLWALAATALLRVEIEISGLEHVDPEKQYLVVALHEGFADAVALLRLPLGLRFTVRDELFDWPALGRYLRATSQVRVDEQPGVGSLRRLYREIGTVFDDGDSLVVFPQGSILGLEVAFRPGAFRMARHFGRPVLPVVLTGTHMVWEHPFSPRVRLGQQVTMQILPPIEVPDMNSTAPYRLERAMKHLALEADTPVRHFIPERDGWWDGYQFAVDPEFPELARRAAARRAGGPEATSSGGDDADPTPEGDVPSDGLGRL